MCLHPCRINEIPEQTIAVAWAAFPKGNIYMTMRDELGVFYTDEAFAELFSNLGQPAESPWRLALVTIMQFAENLTDRQAADAVRSRIDWKYALGLELTDPGFHFSVLELLRNRSGGMVPLPGLEVYPATCRSGRRRIRRLTRAATIAKTSLCVARA
jgi:transposase